MYKFCPYFTNDGSVGLVGDEDIYHSTYGARSEAYEKFILPANIQSADEIKILDICFGIGYNTKSFLNEIFTQKFSFKTLHIDAIDTDKILAHLSPFFVTGKKKFTNKTIANEKVKKLLRTKVKPKYKLRRETNIILLELMKLADSAVCTPQATTNSHFRNDILNNKEYVPYFDKYMVNLHLGAFLHNIYYRYVSGSYKNAMKYLKNHKITFSLHTDDARQVIGRLNGAYDYIFLDAFTPAKCPCLWTTDFFKLLYERLNETGALLTYSKAAPVRNAFLQAGFHVGKTSDGTIATKNPALIKTPLSEYDLGLLNTRAGIVYRDEALSLDNASILTRRAEESANSELETSSHYIKMKNQHCQEQ